MRTLMHPGSIRPVHGTRLLRQLSSGRRRALAPRGRSIGERGLPAQLRPRRGLAIGSHAHPIHPLILGIALAALGCSERVSWIGFHGDAVRSGWNPRETTLTPETVSSGRFGKRWDSPPFDAFEGVPFVLGIGD